MQRTYSLFAAFVLTAFLALIAFKIDTEILEEETVNAEQLDAEDLLEDDKAEIEFQLKDFHAINSELSIFALNQQPHSNYSFAIKLNSQEVHSPPPEA